MSSEWIDCKFFDVRYIDSAGRTYFIDQYDKRADAEKKCEQLNESKKECYKHSGFEHNEINKEESKTEWNDGDERYQVFMMKGRKCKKGDTFHFGGNTGYGARFCFNMFYLEQGCPGAYIVKEFYDKGLASAFCKRQNASPNKMDLVNKKFPSNCFKGTGDYECGVGQYDYILK